ncbi:MAG: hypothetical protein NVS2B16_15540 [Chloroflexota bacterium]
MNLHLGADVRQTDGEKLGELQGVVYDPQEQKIMALVVQSAGAQQRDMLVTVRALAGDDGDGETIYMNVTQAQFNNMKPLDASTRNLAPLPDVDDAGTVQGNDSSNVPDVLPIGAATGIEFIAYTPIVQEDTNLRDGDVVIGRSTMVAASDGDIGQVAHLIVDQDGWNITSLVAERGLIFTHDTEVPFDLVAVVDGEKIIVNATSEEMRSKS